MNRDKTEIEMIKMVNAKRDYEEVGKYIISEFYRMAEDTKNKGYELNLTPNEYKKIERYLLEKYRLEGQKLMGRTKLSKDDILAGKASFEIYKTIRILQANFMSVKDEIARQEEEERQAEIEFKTKKKNKARNERIKKLLFAVTISSAITITGLSALEIYNNYEEDKELTSAIGYIVSEEENDKRNIVEQNIYRASFDSKGKEVYDLNIESLANDIITLCKNNPDLFDIAIYNVYSNLDGNKLSTMDSLIVCLRDMAKEDERLDFIFSKLDNCRVFLDYLVNRGFLNPNSEDYYAILNDIELYIETKTYGAEGLERLPEKSSTRLQGIIDAFEANRDNLYSEYKDVIDGMVGDEFGTR